MITESPKKSGFDNSTKASLGAFALSAIVHGAILLILGSYVVFDKVIVRQPFEAVPISSSSSIDEPVMQEPQEITDPLDTPQITNDLAPSLDNEPAAGEATSADILVSTAPNPTFSLSPAVGPSAAIPKLGWGTGTGGKDATGRGGGVAGGKIIKSIFGQSESTPAALKGTMIDLKQPKAGATTDQKLFLKQFAESGFRKSMLHDYYNARLELYATQFFMPNIEADEAPKAFQAEKEIQPRNWLIYYEGQFASPDNATYRFVGSGDDVLIVRVNDKIVLDGSRSTSGAKTSGAPDPITSWVPTMENILAGPKMLPSGPAVNGDWMTLEAGKNNKIEIVIGEIPGGKFGCYLFIEKQGKEYDKDPKRGGAPILPLFRTLAGKDDWSEYKPEAIPAYERRGPIFTPR
jgi:hypothetical protein